eukprot:83784-Hanusia_phi.AAC.1
MHLPQADRIQVGNTPFKLKLSSAGAARGDSGCPISVRDWLWYHSIEFRSSGPGTTGEALNRTRSVTVRLMRQRRTRKSEHKKRHYSTRLRPGKSHCGKLEMLPYHPNRAGTCCQPHRTGLPGH